MAAAARLHRHGPPGDAVVGGRYRMSFTNLATGHSHAFGGTYLELVPHERIRNTDTFEVPG
jgi:uncharacterized protein YndB with AHSA1/START domain